MAGADLSSFDLKPSSNGHVAVKTPVFPFARFPGVDILLGPEMKSTGEVMGLDRNFETAFLKSQIAAGLALPTEGQVFVSVKTSDREAVLPLARDLIGMGFEVISTRGTGQFLQEQGLQIQTINKVTEGRPHIVDAMKDGDIRLVLNTTEGKQSIADSYSLRRTALMEGIPYYTTMSGCCAAVEALRMLKSGSLPSPRLPRA